MLTRKCNFQLGLTIGHRKNNHYQKDQPLLSGASVGGWINEYNNAPFVDAHQRPNHVYIGANQPPRNWFHHWKDWDIQTFAHNICEKFHKIMLSFYRLYMTYPPGSNVSVVFF